jgi:hypothetical protein
MARFPSLFGGRAWLKKSRAKGVSEVVRDLFIALTIRASPGALAGVNTLAEDLAKIHPLKFRPWEGEL